MNGMPTITFYGVPNVTYDIQRSTNLMTGALGWVTLWETNAPGGGAYQYTDQFNDLGIAPAAALYRLQVP
jgi:hypothetical protein